MSELVNFERDLQTLTERAQLAQGDNLALREQIDQLRNTLLGRLVACTAQIEQLQTQLAEETQRRQQNELPTALFETTLELINRLDVAEVLPIILQRAAQLLNAPDGVIFLLDPEHEVMEARIGLGKATSWVGYQLTHDSPGLASQVWQTGEPQVVDDYAGWGQRTPTLPPSEQYRTLLAVPLRDGNTIAGILGLHREVGPSFSAAEVEISVRFGQLAALALHNAHLFTATQQELEERRRTEEALRTSEQRLRRMVEQLPAGAVYVEGERLWLNRQAEAITGYDRTELLTLADWFTKIYPHQSQQMQTRYRLAQQEQRSRATTAHITRQDGHIRLVEFSIFAEADNAVWLLRDVTESERSSRLLAQTERAALVGGWEQTYQPRQLFWTDELYRILEVDPATFTPSSEALLAFQPPDAAEAMLAARRHLIETGEPIDTVLHQCTYSGRRIWTRMTANVEYDETGAARRIYGSIQDISATKAVEDALKASEQKYRALIETTGTGFAITDAAGSLLEANAEYLRLTGRSTLDEILGQTPVAWTAEHDRARNADAFRRILSAGSLRDLEIDYVTPEGVINPVEINATTLATEDGVRIIGLCRDIRFRKEAALALEEGEERFRQLVEHLDEVFWLTTYPQRRVLYLSPAFETIWGRPRAEIYTDTLFGLETIHPDDRERVRTHALQLDSGGYDIEFRIVRPDGAIRWIRSQAFPVRNQSGVIYRVAGIDEDITERQLAAERLRESEERLRQLTENIDEGFWLADARGVLYVSPAYERIWGRPAAEFYTAPWHWLSTVHPDDQARIRQAVLEKQDVGRYDEEYRILHRDGAVRWLRDRAFPIRNASGAVVRIAGLAEDITAQKRQEDAMQLLIECSRVTGHLFFAKLVSTLAQVLGVRHVLLCEHREQSRLRMQSVAVWANGAGGEPITFAVSDTPFVRSVLLETTVIAQGAQRRFPNDRLLKRFNADGVMGAPLRAASGAVIGVLLTLDEGAFSLEGNPVAVSEIFAGRAAAELEREQAEQELHRQRNEFQQMLDAVNAAVWRLDNAGRVVQANRMARNSTHGVSGEVVGKRLTELFPDDPNVQAMERESLAVVASGVAQLSQISEWHHRKDKRWSSVDQIPLRNDAGQVNGLLVFIYGITELKAAETAIMQLNADLEQRVAERTAQLANANEALRASEARQRALLEAMPDLFFRIHRDGYFLDFSTPANASTLLPRAEIIGTRISELNMPASVIDESLLAYERALTTGEMQTVEYAIAAPAGLNYFEQRIVRSGPDEVVAIVRDITQRVRAQEALRASEEKFAKLFYNSPLHMVITRLRDGMFVEVNDEFLKFLGRTRDEVIGSTSSQLGVWQDPAECGHFVQQLRIYGVIRNQELNLIIGSGALRNTLISAVQITLAGEECALVAAADITERKLVHQALQLSEQRLRQIIDLVPHLIFAKDLYGRFVLANQTMALLVGATPQEMIDHPDAPFSATPEQIEHFNADDLEVIQTGNTMVIPEETLTDHTGQIHTLRTIKIPFTFSGTTTPCVLGVSTDITELKQAEMALRESEARFRQFAEHLPFIVWMLSPDATRFIYRNSAFAEIVGRPMAGRSNTIATLFDVIHPDDREKVVEFLRQLDQNLPMQFEFRVVRPAGDLRWLHARFFPVRNESDEVTLYTGIAEDITQRKAAEREIHQLNEQLEERVRRRTHELEAANRELESFSYSVSHDLRAPLRAINGFSQALYEDYGHLFDGEGLNYLERVRAASQRMAVLIDDLLTLSRVTRQEMKRTLVNLSVLAHAVADELQRTQPERQVRFTIAPDLWSEADPSLMHVVLDNLLTNAWKYSSKHAQAQIEFGSFAQEAEIVYFVRDDGAGFDMAYADKLFGAFQRLHRDSEFEGSGVGLATVQRIIHRHGGRTWAIGAVEQGATFYFSFPA